MVARMTNTTSGDAPAPSTAALREQFNKRVAPGLADQIGLPQQVVGGKFSKRFAFFADDEQFAVIAGTQEKGDVELALAHGVRYAEHRPLTLVLPEGHTNATEQRIPWLRKAAQPTLFVFGPDQKPAQRPLRSRRDTLNAFAEARKKDQSPADDLGKALAPAHLGRATGGVWQLVERATTDPALDHGHRPGERSWHCAGQRVLSISRITGGVRILAGIHYSGAKQPLKKDLADGDILSNQEIETIYAAIDAAKAVRLQYGDQQIHRADEHWLQSVLRTSPNLAGVEQPAMREVPAWRPHDAPARWGRGFLDLVGLDGHGNIRLIETKLATNSDDLLILQGLDYFVWAKAYETVLRSRLNAPKAAEFELHYVLAANPANDDIKTSPCTRPLAEALADDIPWRFQTIHHWFPEPRRHPHAQLSAMHQVLPEAAQ